LKCEWGLEFGRESWRGKAVLVGILIEVRWGKEKEAEDAAGPLFELS